MIFILLLFLLFLNVRKVLKQGKVEGLEEGKIKFHETFVDGFENLPQAYEMLFTGENIGKVVVRV